MSVHKNFEPRLRKNYLLAAASVLFAAAVAAMWVFRETLSLDIPLLIMLSGLALLLILFTAVGYRRKKEDFLTAEELKRQREEMDTNFSDSGIFFRDE